MRINKPRYFLQTVLILSNGEHSLVVIQIKLIIEIIKNISPYPDQDSSCAQYYALRLYNVRLSTFRWIATDQLWHCLQETFFDLEVMCLDAVVNEWVDLAVIATATEKCHIQWEE